MGLLTDVIVKLVEELFDVSLDKTARAEFLQARGEGIAHLRLSDKGTQVDQERLEKAISRFYFALGRNGTRREKAEICFNLGLCYDKLGWWSDAASSYEECIRHNRKHPKARVYLAYARVACQEVDKAVQCLKEHLRVYPGDKEAETLMELWQNLPSPAAIPPQDAAGP